MKKILFSLMFFALVGNAEAKINVFACEPEWGALVSELAGDLASVYNATNAYQDPHQIQAKPSLIAKTRSADLLVCTGAELEIGWLPILLQQSGNSKIQPGGVGYFEAAHSVKMLEVPTAVDRSQGDVHSFGNPHIQTSPKNIGMVAPALSARLAQIDPQNADEYRRRYEKFSEKWGNAVLAWEKKGAVLKGTPVVVHHKFWVYLSDWLGLVEVASLEPKPGVEPSAAYLSSLLDKMKANQAKLILRSNYNDERPSLWLSQKTGIPAIQLPATVGGSPKAMTLYGYFDEIIDQLTGGGK
jgi:zinc/manganese transport system substrate-binding protein